MQDLFEYLVEAYRIKLEEINPGMTPTVATAIIRCQPFVEFSRNLIQTRGVAGLFPVDNGYGLILGNNDRVTLGDSGIQWDDINNVDTSGSMKV